MYILILKNNKKKGEIMKKRIMKDIILARLSTLSRLKDEIGLLKYLKTRVFEMYDFEYIDDNYLAFLLRFGELRCFEKEQLVKILEDRAPTFERRGWIRRTVQGIYGNKNNGDHIRQLVFN